MITTGTRLLTRSQRQIGALCGTGLAVALIAGSFGLGTAASLVASAGSLVALSLARWGEGYVLGLGLMCLIGFSTLTQGPVTSSPQGYTRAISDHAARRSTPGDPAGQVAGRSQHASAGIGPLAALW